MKKVIILAVILVISLSSLVIAYDSPCAEDRCGDLIGTRTITDCNLKACSDGRDEKEVWKCNKYSCSNIFGNYTAYDETYHSVSCVTGC